MRNVVRNHGNLLEIALFNAKHYNEIWYWAPEGQKAFNRKGRKGWEQFSSLACFPNGNQVPLDAFAESIPE